jgi:hypothetical protein
MIGQNAVFDRAEQRADHAEPEQGNEQNDQRNDRWLTGIFAGMDHKTKDRDRGDADLDEFQTPCHHRLVVAVSDLAAERRQEEVRRDEDRTRERNERLAAGPHMEQDQEDDRVLQEVVVEGGEKLAPEQWREAPGQHQRLRRFGHARQSPDVVQNGFHPSRSCPPPV